jgi:protein TonB
MPAAGGAKPAGKTGGTHRVNVDLDGPATQRAVSLGVVVLLHVLLIALLISQSATIRSFIPTVTIARLVQAPAPRPKPPDIKPQLQPPLMQVPVPDINVPPPPSQQAAPRAIVRVGPHGPPVSHFGSASGDAGLGIDAATTSGGGAGSRGSLADFEAEVKRAVLSQKRQPALAWDRRNTCVVNYAVTISRSGALAGLSIDPCGVPEINQAAQDAIRAAAPFSLPPDLGAATTTVHGTLIFRP